jgi:hypothetical protein
LPPAMSDAAAAAPAVDPKGTYIANCGQDYKVARLPDFMLFRDRVLCEDDWKSAYKSKPGKGTSVQCFTQPAAEDSAGAGLNIIKVVVEFPTLDPAVIYDALHDPEFRKTWDNNMLKGYNLCQLDARNDIGYYAAKFPWPLQDRDFLNLRSWMEFDNGEYIIMNYSVKHSEVPETTKFTRGLSYNTGYYLKPMNNGPSVGTKMLYLSHSDPKGNIPHMVLNSTMTSLVPKMMAALETNSNNYAAWSAENHPQGYVPPWLTPKQSWNPAAAEAAPVSLLARTASAAEGSAASEQAADGTDRAAAVPVVTSSKEVEAMQQQLDMLKRQLFIANQKGGSDITLAPVAPRQDDTRAVQQFRSMMHDALNFVDRQYVQEGRVPTMEEYLTRLRGVIEGLAKTAKNVPPTA